MKAIWLNRSGARLPDGIVPDATVASLSSLPGVLANLGTAG
jgi:FMN phosphatase YigB (HAD superfamily)